MIMLRAQAAYGPVYVRLPDTEGGVEIFTA